MLDPAGARRWSSELEGDWRWTWGAVDAGSVYVAVGTQRTEAAPVSGSTRVFKLARTDGHDQWLGSSDIPGFPFEPPPPGTIEGRVIPTPRIWKDPASDRLLYAAPDGSGLQFR